MSSFFKNVLWLQAGFLGSQGLAFIISSLFFYKVLGDVQFGVMTALFTFQEAIMLLLYWDPGTVMIHRLAKAPENKRELLKGGWNFLLISSMALAALAGLAGPQLINIWLENWKDVVDLGDLSMASMALALIYVTAFPLQWSVSALQGFEDMKSASLLLMMQNLARPLGTLAGWSFSLFQDTPLLTSMVLGIASYQLLMSLPALLMVNRHDRGIVFACLIPNVTLPDSEMTKEIFLLSADKKIGDFYDHIPRWIVGYLFMPVMLGHFRILLTLFGLLQSLLNPLSRVLLPRLTRAHSEQGLVDLKEKVWKVIRSGFALGTIMALGMGLLTYFVLLPHQSLYAMSEHRVQELSQAGWVLLLLFPFFGFGVSNSPLALILKKVQRLFELKLYVTLPLVALSVLLISNMALFGACLYVTLYRGFQRLVASVLLHKELNHRLKTENR